MEFKAKSGGFRVSAIWWTGGEVIGGSGESGTVCMRSCQMFIFSWLASVCSRRALKTSKSPWASKGLHAAMVIMHNDQIKNNKKVERSRKSGGASKPNPWVARSLLLANRKSIWGYDNKEEKGCKCLAYSVRFCKHSSQMFSEMYWQNRSRGKKNIKTGPF